MKRIFLRYRKKSLFVVNSFILSELFSNKSCFISFNVAQWILICLENPFTSNGFYTIRQLNKIPNSITCHRIHLIFHSMVALNSERNSLKKRWVHLKISLTKTNFPFISFMRKWIKIQQTPKYKTFNPNIFSTSKRILKWKTHLWLNNPQQEEAPFRFPETLKKFHLWWRNMKICRFFLINLCIK